MGIPELWQLFDKAEIGENIPTSAFAAAHFERERRPLRIAIDVSIWKFKCYQEPQQVAAIRRNVPAANPNEKNLLYKILKLLKLNVQLIFVADGKNRPAEKFGGQSPWYKYRSQDDTLLKQTVSSLGVIWHEAPGEAEAECAAMQSRGVVDAVWTEDSDAFIREVDIDNIIVYRAHKIQRKFPGLTQEGLELFAVLKGGDYSKNGKSLTNCGAVLSLDIATAKEDFSKDLCNAHVADYPAWRARLREYLTKTNSRVDVPDNFPDPRIVSLYNRPLVSSERIMSDIGKLWNPSFDELELQKVIAPRFNFWVAEYIKYVIPILLVRSLASTQPGQEASNNCYKLRIISKKKVPMLQKSVEVLLSAVTTMDIPTWRRDFTFSRGGKIAPVTEMVKCEDLLSCIIEHGTKDVIPSATPPSKYGESTVAPDIMSKGKRRASSPLNPSKIPSLPLEHQPSAKRVKNTWEQSSVPRLLGESLIKSASPHIGISQQAPNIPSSTTKGTLSRNLSELDGNRTRLEQHRETQLPNSPRLGNAKKSSAITIDLTLDDSSDEDKK
ncbi:hypothetical protein SBOR_1894 [Sclerotinia borealis F-4128]|uniref:XPG-I domain-containing protein n=1 Tax=Sclerotinia borealis (strain F-4128) TaxID=1432307 RepID=W9CLN3_SCLBF|nr:hypothetical protein SBOR_1894 [Sclerotinia borealis F-4128]